MAPVLAPIGNKSGTVGVAITFTATATDADIPANTLAFSLDAGAPSGATINASTGAFSWTPAAAGSFPVTVRVTDNGTPVLERLRDDHDHGEAGQQDFVPAHAFFYGHQSADDSRVKGSRHLRPDRAGARLVRHQRCRSGQHRDDLQGTSDHRGAKAQNRRRQESQRRAGDPGLLLEVGSPAPLRGPAARLQQGDRGRIRAGSCRTARFSDTAHHFVLVLGIDCFAMKASPNPLNPETVLSFATTRPRTRDGSDLRRPGPPGEVALQRDHGGRR